MLNDVVDLLRCPHCGQGFGLHAGVLRCAGGHVFDVARQGYVNLLPRRPSTGTGDTPAMVQARAAFLGRGHFEPFAAAVAAALSEGTDVAGPVAEVGAGTGYYLAAALERRRGCGLALDVSSAAARRSARAHERIGSVVADAWTSLPLADACLVAALVAFAPRSGAELARVVRPGGTLVVLTPDHDHLAELRATLGLLDVDPRKAERLAASLGSGFDPVSEQSVRWLLHLDRLDVRDLVLMGPNAVHQDQRDLDERIAALPERMEVTASGVVHVLRRR